MTIRLESVITDTSVSGEYRFHTCTFKVTKTSWLDMLLARPEKVIRCYERVFYSTWKKQFGKWVWTSYAPLNTVYSSAESRLLSEWLWEEDAKRVADEQDVKRLQILQLYKDTTQIKAGGTD